jgi:Uma2 family endonuclease
LEIGFKNLLLRKNKSMVAVVNMTYEQFRFMEIPDGDNSIYELINGNIVRRSSPHSEHQIAQANLMRLLGNFVYQNGLGRVMGAPMDVVFSEEIAPQPDVFFIKKEREKIIERGGPVWGSPDLIIEIISSGTAKADRKDKKEIYEHFGVAEYWLVEPRARTVEVFSLENGVYKNFVFIENEGIIKSKLLEGLEMDIADIFD